MAMRASKAKNNQIDRLTDCEWRTLVASWRYFEYRSTIASASFPEDIVSRFFTGKYTPDVCEQIARQFSQVDHGTRGESDWVSEGLRDCDTVPWTKFFRFCEGYVRGFHKLVLTDGKKTEKVDAFHVAYNDTWYPVKNYVKAPMSECYCPKEYIVSIDGEPYEWKGEVK